MLTPAPPAPLEEDVVDLVEPLVVPALVVPALMLLPLLPTLLTLGLHPPTNCDEFSVYTVLLSPVLSSS